MVEKDIQLSNAEFLSRYEAQSYHSPVLRAYHQRLAALDDQLTDMDVQTATACPVCEAELNLELVIVPEEESEYIKVSLK